MSQTFYSNCLLFLQLVEEVQVKQPEVEAVLERADQLFKENPPNQQDKVMDMFVAYMCEVAISK